MSLRHGVDWRRALALAGAERASFEGRNPASRALAARFRDADGHDYTDFCLGDTGAMFGHAPEPVARAIAHQAGRGYTAMLPSEDAAWVAEELARRVEAAKRAAPPGHSGIGTTLTANMFALAAMRANLAEVMSEAAYATMFALAGQLAEGLRAVIARRGLPWCVTQVGTRAPASDYAAANPTYGLLHSDVS